MKSYSNEEYHSRSGIENGFGCVKDKYGGAISGKKCKSVRAEICCKLIANNLNLAKM